MKNYFCLFGIKAQSDIVETTVTKNYAYFEVDLDTTLNKELSSDLYMELLEKYTREFGYENKEQARKNPVIVQHIIQDALKKGRECVVLKRIVENIVKLKQLGDK